MDAQAWYRCELQNTTSARCEAPASQLHRG